MPASLFLAVSILVPAGCNGLAEKRQAATFTSIDSMTEAAPGEGDEDMLEKTNRMYLDGCYYTGDTSTPFRASFSERWNKMVFLRRFVHAEELFERANSDPLDSLDRKTVHGTIDLLPDEYQLAFRKTGSRKMAEELVRKLETIEYEEESCNRMEELFRELLQDPFETPDFVSDEGIDSVRIEFWDRYDKSLYVKDIIGIQKTRVEADSDSEELKDLCKLLVHRYAAETDFDARCIYAIELACCDYREAVDYLGELIEDGRYSKYLLEAWLFWRLSAQSIVFGISTWSEIPDNLYDRARLLVAETFVRHIESNEDDLLAKVLLMNLTYTENLHRFWGYFGNEALAMDLAKTKYFLPPEVVGDAEEEGSL